VESPTAVAKPVVTDTVSAPTSAPPKAVTQDPRPKAPTEASDAKQSIVDPAKSPANAAEKSPTKASTVTPRSSGYSVQVAAYSRKSEADKLTASLVRRGYQARVDGEVAPFRVRIGRYATNKEAEDALSRIKAKHMDGFVVRAPER
jgi:cell division protein FtsN